MYSKPSLTKMLVPQLVIVYQYTHNSQVLVKIAEDRNIEVTESVKKNIVKHLSSHVLSTGITKALSCTPNYILKKLEAHVPDDSKKKSSVKNAIVKRTFEEMEKVGPKKFLDKVDDATMKALLTRLDVDTDGVKDYSDAFIKVAEEFGLDNFFSSFAVEQLKDFADECDLIVDSDSREILIESLVTQTNYKAPKKDKKKIPKPSKIKPPIKLGITNVDLIAHYNKDELVDFLKEKRVTSGGNKKELAKRIIGFLDGKVKPENKKRKASSSPSKSPPAKKARKTSVGKSDKNEKSPKEKKTRKSSK